MSRFARFFAALSIFGALPVAGAVVLAAPAHAAPIGHVVIVPGDSIDLAAIRIRTSGGCPAPADAYYARAHGHGFPAEGQLVTPNTSAGLSHTAGFDVYFAQTMKDYADDNNTTLTGRYDITVYCVDSFTLVSYGEFTGSLRFTTPTKYTALGSAKPTGTPPPPIGAGEPVALPPGGGEVPPTQGAPGAPAAQAAAPGMGPGDSPEDINLLPMVLVALAVFGGIVAIAGFRRWRARSSAGAAVLLVAASVILVAGPAARPAAAQGQPEITIGVVITPTEPTEPTGPTTTEPTEPTATEPTATGPAQPTEPPVAGGGSGGGLSYTGSPAGLILAAGLALIAVGTAVVTAARRRRHP